MSASLRKLLVMVCVPFFLAAGALAYYVLTAHVVTTDNAYIKQDKISVSAEVGGNLVEVAVTENQQVAKGDLLFRIDPDPYQLAVDRAASAVDTAQARLKELEAALVAARVKEDRAQENIVYYEKEFARQTTLRKTSVTSEANLQTAEHNLQQAHADLATARAEMGESQAALATGHASVTDAQVQLAQAQLNLARTTVRAPAAGIVSQTERLHVGQLMMQNLPAVTIVQNHSSWVEANFKETDLNNMKVGQPVVIEVDSYNDLRLNGQVASIGAGTGSEFSILPAQNANANWVKVTQRVPVRIAIIDASAQPLIAGLSVNVRVDTSQ